MYVGYFLLSLFLSVILTAVVYTLMRRLRVVDHVRKEKRKIHKKKTPLGGGLAIFATFFVLAAIFLIFGDIGHDVTARNIAGLFVGGLVLVVGGFLDDKYRLRPHYQIVFPVVAALSVVGFGIGPHEITNPLGGIFALDQWKVSFESLGTLVVVADLLVFFWLMGMMFTTKFLDGLDGLVSGVVAIGALMIFFLSTQERWHQPEVALLALVFAGSCLGFLVWNWHPAKIFLGEGGSLFTGYLLGALAIISGGKIATTLLVMAFPMLDVGRVIVRRIQKRKPIYEGDSEHLHFKLLQSGLTQKQAVLLFYAISTMFGVSALFLQSNQKVMALLFLFVLMLLLGIWFMRQEKQGA